MRWRTGAALVGLIALGGCSRAVPGTVASGPEGEGGSGAMPWPVDVRIGPQPCLEFGDVVLGSSVVKPLAITNGGASDLHLTLTTTSPAFELPWTSVDVAAGTTREVAVRFRPRQRADARSDVVVVLADGRSALACVHGRGLDGWVEFTPPFLEFQPRRWDESRCLPVQVRTLDVAATLDRFEVTGDAPFSTGAMEVPIGGTIPPHTAVQLEVCMTPAGQGRAWIGNARVEAGGWSGDVKLTGRFPLASVEDGPCDLTAWPDVVDFGFVHVSREAVTSNLRLHNGEGTCRLSEFHVSGPPFSVSEADHTLGPGEDLVVPVRFQSLEPTVAPLAGQLVFRQEAGGISALSSVALRGFASDFCLEADPPVVDFGHVPFGYVPEMPVRLRNCGTNLVKVGGNARQEQGDVATVNPTGSPFAVPDARRRLPVTIRSGESMEVRVRFDPADLLPHDAWLELWPGSEVPPVRVPLHGQAVDEPCGALCEPVPEITCSASGAELPYESATLVAGSAGDVASCTWMPMGAPYGSTATLPDPGSCRTSFTPDAAGDYAFHVTVRSPSGRESGCDVTLHAWSLSGVVRLTWDRPDDLDLHFFHPAAGDLSDPASWSDLTYDCNFENQWPYWDTVSRLDDPRLLRDDQEGQGPEVIRLLQPVTTHPYEIGVHWFDSAHGHASIDVTLEVFCGGEPFPKITRTLTRPGEAAHLATFRWFPDNSCQLTEASGSFVLVR